MKIYLIILGLILIVTGILGFAGVIGPDPDHSPWHGKWYFDQLENFGHTLGGLILLLGAFITSDVNKKRLIVLIAIAGIFAGFYSLAISNVIFTANLQHPADTIFHFIIGLSAITVLYFKKSTNHASTRWNLH